MSARVRIIGGRWRRRILRFAEHGELRPTPDRVRETLFNWLAPRIEGARCLDLFAGSGALGFEAASRGAAEVLMLEREPAVVRSLRASARLLGAGTVQVLEVDARQWLRENRGRFDVAFVDPPFAGALAADACALLDEHGWLAPGAAVYVESARRDPPPAVPAHWRPWRGGTAGRVRYHLYTAAET